MIHDLRISSNYIILSPKILQKTNGSDQNTVSTHILYHLIKAMMFGNSMRTRGKTQSLCSI